MKAKTIGGKILAATIVVYLLWTGTASGQTNTYRFDPNQSSVFQHFFTSDTYNLTGAFQLTIDANTASFDWVNATFSDDPNLQTGDLEELFYMDELVGDVVNNTTIEFELPPGHPVLQSYDIHITVTFQNDQAHLTGYRNPLMVGEPGYTLDAVAVLVNIVYVDDDGPADFNNIQAAIDDSSDGDTIIIADGTYTGAGNREISFLGKAITVRSENGPENCIIDCQGKGIGFLFRDGEDVNSILDGLTITNGYSSGCGALYIDSYSSPMIINCKFENNHAGGQGGAIHCHSNYSPKLTNCIFTGNSSRYGGGIFISEGSPILTNCTFSGNSAVSYGGAVHCEEISTPTIRNCLIIGNKTEWQGGGISITDGSDAIIENCTISDNIASDKGGGIFCPSRMTVSNSILWGSSPEQIYYDPFGISVNHSDVQGGWPGSDNIDADPLFAAPGYWDANGLWIDGDYHLLPGSPCIDTGDSAYIPYPGETDIDGEPRVMGGRVDMGVDEFTSTPTPFIEISPTELTFYATQGSPNPKSQIISIRNIGSGTLNWEIAEDCPWLQVYPQNGESTGQVNEVTLSVDISGLNPGVYNCQLIITANEAANSPQMAAITLYLGAVLRVPSEYTTIQAAINAAEDNDTVLVADGTYTGTGNRDIDFHGKAITVRGENGPGKCIIDCKGTNDEPHRGFYLHSGEDRNSVVAGFTITNGYAIWGGGIFCSHASPAVTNCTFSNNSATEGGAIWIFDEGKGTTLTNCTFSRNSAGRNGGGIYIMDSSPILTNCTFSGNSAGVYGGAVAVRCEEISSPTIKNCLIIGNRAEDDGGGIYSSDESHTIIENCTISDNSANDKGGGIYCHSGIMIVSNSILWGSSPDQIAPYYKPVINHSDVEGGWPGEGNIDIDPLFVDAIGGNYHLLADSPCIDTGDPYYMAELNETDLDGSPRIVNGTVDMGAYEFQGIQILYVDADAPDGGDGGSWPTAFRYLQDALFNAIPPTEIRVAQGIYKPHLNTYSAAPPSRTDTFQLKNGLTLKGGYAGLGEPDPDSRDIKLYETILSGDVNGDDEPNFVNNSDNSYHVVTGSGNNATTVLDGFTITGGNATGDGGGICGNGTEATIANCIITNNHADGVGGGVSNSSGRIVGCTITGNTAGGDGLDGGGGIYVFDCSVTIEDCDINNNTAGDNGGGLCFIASPGSRITRCTISDNDAIKSGRADGGGIFVLGVPPILIEDCRIRRNYATHGGGGVYLGGEAGPIPGEIQIRQCLITDNTAGEEGGGISCEASVEPRISNCTIADNQVTSAAGVGYGGGLNCSNGSNVEVINSIIWGNFAEQGFQVAVRLEMPGPSTLTLSHSDVEGGPGGAYVGLGCTLDWGIGAIDSDPQLVDPNGGDWHLGVGSPCIDAGDNTAVPPSLVKDLDGNPRIVNGTVDMGAYEFCGPVYVDDDGPNDPGPGDPQVSDPLENGTEDHPFDTIQEAIDLAADGYTVLVRQGSYFEPAPSSTIDFLGKNITLTSEDPTDWDIVNNTVIRGYVQFSGTEGPNCKFTGFRISDIEGAIYGGNHTHATISHCNISGNGPCGVTVIKDCDGTISNCLITDNTTFFKCGVFPVVFGCNGVIKNCTIANNDSGLNVGTAIIKNCIIYNNSGSQLGVDDSETLNISYCNLQGGLEDITGGGIVNWGPGNIDTDPCFVRLGYWIIDEVTLIEGDYHLRSEGWRWNTEGKSWTYDFVTSRCVDAGNPASDLGDELMSVPRDPDNIWGVNIRVNMGAYGGTGQASMPPHGWTLLADLNNDGTTDFADFAYQAQDWLITAPEQPGDLNRDGVLNRRDLALLAEEWLRVTDSTNQPPVVYITQPPDGCEFCWLTESVQIEADVSDVDGLVVKVEFFVNGAKIGEDKNGTDDWLYVTSFNIGTYTLTAKATDNKGAKATSPPVKIKAVECQ